MVTGPGAAKLEARRRSLAPVGAPVTVVVVVTPLVVVVEVVGRLNRILTWPELDSMGTAGELG